MSVLPQSEEIRFRDSGKVLRDIQEILGRPQVGPTPLTAKDSGIVAARNSDTVKLISEVIENAPTTAKIHAKRSAPPNGLDTRNIGPGDGDSWGPE